MAKQKIIIDTDPGIDDAMAIFLALVSPELEVLGLTTIFGNVHVDLATTNALRLLEIAGHSNIPVAQGAGNPLVGDFPGPSTYIHGVDGQGDLHLSPPKAKPLSIPAAQFIVEQVMTHPGEITLVPIGPLTNIALAMRLEPHLAENTKQVVLMGGNAIVPGNATPAAEANIWHDPEAADMVFGANWREGLTMIGLDVTTKTVMQDHHLDNFIKSHSAIAQHISRILPIYRDFHRNSYEMTGIFTHDPSTIAYLIDPSLFKVGNWPIRVEMQGFGRGKTWPNISKRILEPWQNRPRVNTCINVEAERTLELILSRLLA